MVENQFISFPSRVKDLVGIRFGRLLVVRYAGLEKHGHALWFCVCDCGTEHTVRGNRLTSGDTKSCGCFAHEAIGQRRFIHGKTGSPEYEVWRHMIDRCLNASSADYPLYGGRGIAVCGRWMSLSNFLLDMGLRPSPKHSLDRINNDGHYSCGHCLDCLANGWNANCRWATWKEQSRNKHTNQLVTFDGVTKPLVEWASKYSINRCTLTARLRAGWSIHRALTEPVCHRQRPDCAVSIVIPS